MDQNTPGLTVEPAPPTSRLPLILLVLVLTVGSGLAGFFIGQTFNLSTPLTPPTPKETAVPNQSTTTESSTPTPTAPADETSTWKTFSYSTFSIKLPRGWFDSSDNDSNKSFINYDITQAEGRGFSPLLDKGKLKVEVFLENYEGDLNSFVAKQNKVSEELRGSPMLFNDSLIKLDGQDAVKSESGDYPVVIYAKHPTKNVAFSIAFFLDFRNYAQLADQILSTFRFD